MAGNLHLPSPHRTARRGIRLCKRLGMDEATALETIMLVCTATASRQKRPGDIDSAWLADIHEFCRCRLRELRCYD